MSAYSDWQCGAITESDYAFAMREEARKEEWEDIEKTCGNCEYCDWDRRDKPCCYCHDGSEFEMCEQEPEPIILLRD